MNEVLTIDGAEYVRAYPVRSGRCPHCGGNPPLWTASMILAAISSWVLKYGRIPTGDDWEHETPEHPSRKKVVLVFSRWNIAIRAAGFSARRRSVPDAWTDEELLEAIQQWAREHTGEPPSCSDWAPAPKDYPSYRLVANRFGSWNRAIDLAGFFPRHHGCIYTDHTRAKRILLPT